MMSPRLAALSCLLALPAAPQVLRKAAEVVDNVNSRYAVESVEVSGEGRFNLSDDTHEALNSLVGAKLDLPALDDLAKRIRKELHARTVSHKLVRGSQPEHVRVVFEVVPRSVAFDISVPRFLYHSKEGWTGEVESSVSYLNHKFGVGLVSDSDLLVERNAGVYGAYENRKLGTERVKLRFRAESYHQQWNSMTATDPGIYRSRQNFQPTLVVTLTPELTLESGFSLQELETQFPAARSESSNSVINTLRYHRQWEDSVANKHSVDAGYGLRAATKSIGSDFAYTRHLVDAAYTLRSGRHGLAVRFLGGVAGMAAPLFERFILGNSSTLRGWNKFDVAPTGGNRMAHGAVEYRYRFFEVFYDTGAVWNRGQDAIARHSAGFGFRKDGFSLALAFPIRENRVEPMLIAGMNF
jgi:outer membrane protein assembly factor BamA